MTLVVILTVRSEALDKFRAFERKAAIVMAKYGGAIERTVVISPASAGDPIKEIHIVTFPNEQAFAAYQKDEDLKKLAHLRQEAVVQSEIMVGEDGPDYSATNGNQ
jgi:antibiotic biosynthesis monooxygenase (ABM) superfamily enzyme